MIPVIIFLPLFVPFIKAVKIFIRDRMNDGMTEEFIRSLGSVSTSLAAGVSSENAFVTAASDMEKLYGKGSVMVKELSVINSNVAMGQRLSKAMSDFAARWDVREISDFAVVFRVAEENGSNLSEVISSCTAIMEERRRTESEVKVMISGRRYEQRIMCLIPPGIIAYLKLSSENFIGVLYHKPLGIGVMTAALIVFVLAIVLSEKMGDIKV